MRKIILLIMSMFMISLASASIDDLGTFKQNTCVALPQTCGSCTYSNITSILYPNSTIAVSNVVMTKIGTNYNYTFCSTPSLGKYTVNGISDLDGTPTVWAYYFYVTPSGNLNNTGFFFLIIGALYIISFVGFFGKNEWVAMLGGMGLLALGLYTINNGIIIYRDFITDIFSWTTIAIGALFTLLSGLSIIQDTYN